MKLTLAILILCFFGCTIHDPEVINGTITSVAVSVYDDLSPSDQYKILLCDRQVQNIETWKAQNEWLFGKQDGWTKTGLVLMPGESADVYMSGGVMRGATIAVASVDSGYTLSDIYWAIQRLNEKLDKITKLVEK